MEPMRVRAYRDPDSGLAVVVDSKTKAPVSSTRNGIVVLRTCRLGWDKEGARSYVEGEQLPGDVGLVVDGERLAVRQENGQWRVWGLTKALWSPKEQAFYRCDARDEGVLSKAKPLYVCEWGLIPAERRAESGLLVSFT